MAELFAAVDVAQVDFDGGQGDPGYGIPEGIGVVGEGAGIEEKAVRPFAGAVYFIDQHAFVVALDGAGFVFGPGLVDQRAVDLIEANVPVDRPFARAEQIQIGTSAAPGFSPWVALVLAVANRFGRSGLRAAAVKSTQRLCQHGRQRVAYKVRAGVVDNDGISDFPGDDQTQHFALALFVPEHHRVDLVQVEAAGRRGQAQPFETVFDAVGGGLVAPIQGHCHAGGGDGTDGDGFAVAQTVAADLFDGVAESVAEVEGCAPAALEWVFDHDVDLHADGVGDHVGQVGGAFFFQLAEELGRSQDAVLCGFGESGAELGRGQFVQDVGVDESRLRAV